MGVKNLYYGVLITAFSIAAGSYCAGPQQNLNSDQALEGGHPAELVAYFKDHIQKYPSDINARNNLATAYMRLGQYDNAFSELQKVIAQVPNDVTAHYNLALIYNLRGLTDQEIEEYKKTISITPSHYGAHLNLGHALVAKGRYSEAIDQYLWVVATPPDNPKAIYNLGLLYQDLKQKENAVEMFKKYLEIEPGGRYSEPAKRFLSELAGEGIIMKDPVMPRK